MRSNSKQRKGDAEGEMIIIVLLVAVYVGGCSVGSMWTQSHYQTEAVRRGAAERTVDAEGNTSWRWTADLADKYREEATDGSK